MQAVVKQLAALQQQIGELERNIHAQHRASDRSRRLETIPGIGVLGATAIAATITDPSVFKSGRECAAWIGLVPRQNSTGGKERLGGISKQGDRYLRRLLVMEATAVIRHARTHPDKHPWVTKLLAKSGPMISNFSLLTKNLPSAIYATYLRKREAYALPSGAVARLQHLIISGSVDAAIWRPLLTGGVAC